MKTTIRHLKKFIQEHLKENKFRKQADAYDRNLALLEKYPGSLDALSAVIFNNFSEEFLDNEGISDVDDAIANLGIREVSIDGGQTLWFEIEYNSVEWDSESGTWVLGDL